MGIELFTRDTSKYRGVMRKRAELALLEDAKRDITGEACLRKRNTVAKIRFKERGVLCGLVEARGIFRGMKLKEKRKEGEWVGKGEEVLEIRGDVREIVRRNRTALNYISFLSGISTLSRKLVDTHGKRVAGLRKTHPCLTASVKRALQVGGALTHRYNLGDGYLIKHNHITSIAEELETPREIAVMEAVERAYVHRRKSKKKCFIEIEVANEKEALAAARTRADGIMLDNMKQAVVRKIAEKIRKVNKRVALEASGGITEKNIGSYLKAGADFVSMSKLTMGAKPIDVNIEIE